MAVKILQLVQGLLAFINVSYLFQKTDTEVAHVFWFN